MIRMKDKRSTSQVLRAPAIAALGALCLLGAITSTAAAAPHKATDQFMGAAVIPRGQTSPVQIVPQDISVRSDGAIGIGYVYQATGQAIGQMPGSLSYEEHGYLYFANPGDPNSIVGSRFNS